MKQKLKFVGQIALLTGIYLLGNKIAVLAHLPIPGNVVGIVVLYALLNLGVIPLDYVQDAADFLLKHLVFFFIPVAVDLMNWGGIFYRYGLALALAIVISTILTFLGTGYIAQRLQRGEGACLRAVAARCVPAPPTSPPPAERADCAPCSIWLPAWHQ